MTNLVGHSLGRYHILEQIGEGGMATVYKAYDTRLETAVAVKVIRTELFGSAVITRILQRFEREAKTLAKLSHPNIVKLHDYGYHDGSPYLVLEYLPGGTLKERIRKGPIPWQEAIRLLVPIAEALLYAHKHGMVHRDVKSSNILLDKNENPMLTDFGIGKVLENEETITSLTGTGMGVGTPEYMAPEQWRGAVVPQSDQYALGVVLFELITGRKPYEADTPAAILLKQAMDPMPRPKQFVRDLPEPLEKVLFKALMKNPKDRYRDMGEFAKALVEILAAYRAHLAKIAPPKSAIVVPKVEKPKPRPRTVTPFFKVALKKLKWIKFTRRQLQIGGGLLLVVLVLIGLGWVVQQPFLSTLLSFQNIESNRFEETATVFLPSATPNHTPTLTITPTATRIFTSSDVIGSWWYYRTNCDTGVVYDRHDLQIREDGTFTNDIWGDKVGNWLLTGNSIEFSFSENGSRDQGTISREKIIIFRRQSTVCRYADRQIESLTPTPSASASTNTALPEEIIDEKGVTMRLVPAGEFTMGSNQGRGQGPIHQVYLDAYYMDVYEVTNFLYKTCVALNECIPPIKTSSYTRSNYYNNSTYADFPVINVDWNQASAFCEWRGARLPTEAEWEKAARGTDGRAYPWGEGINCDRANYRPGLNADNCVGDTTRTGYYPSGIGLYGLFDMVGNVWEWVADWYSSSYYQISPYMNPLGPNPTNAHVIRGGAWGNQYYSSSSGRYYSMSWGYDVGFRCARSLP